MHDALLPEAVNNSSPDPIDDDEGDENVIVVYAMGGEDDPVEIEESTRTVNEVTH